jgi:hypothetical protein
MTAVQISKDLHAVLVILEEVSAPLRLHHPLFRDFLLSKDRCDANFWVDERQAHLELLTCCIQLIYTSLKQDICGAGAPGMLAADMEKLSRAKSSPRATVCMPVLYWTTLNASQCRLCTSSIMNNSGSELEKAYKKRYNYCVSLSYIPIPYVSNEPGLLHEGRLPNAVTQKLKNP